MIVELLKYLTTEYIGSQYTWIVQHLCQQNLTFQQLLEIGELKFEQLVECLKHLMKINIVQIDKRIELITYKLNRVNLLYYQRRSKYIKYMKIFYKKQELTIIRYFLQHQLPFKEFLDSVCTANSDREKYKQVLEGLLKKKILNKQEQEFDFKVYNTTKQESITEIQTIQSKQQKVENSSQTQRNQINNTTQIKSNIDNPDESVENHCYHVSKSTIHQRILDCLQVQFLIKQSQSQKQQKEQIDFTDKMRKSVNHNISKTNFTENMRKSVNHTLKKEQINFTENMRKSVNNNFYYKEVLPKVDPTTIVKQYLLSNYISEKYSKSALQVYSSLNKNSYIGERQISEKTSLQIKQIRSACDLLQQFGIIKMMQVKIQNMLTRIYCLQKKYIEKQYINYVTRTIINLHVCSKKQQQEFNQLSRQTLLKLLKIEEDISILDDYLILFGY